MILRPERVRAAPRDTVTYALKTECHQGETNDDTRYTVLACFVKATKPHSVRCDSVYHGISSHTTVILAHLHGHDSDVAKVLLAADSAEAQHRSTANELNRPAQLGFLMCSQSL